jgi:hypothetical protein
MAGEQHGFETKWGELVSKAWADPALKKRLLADPAAVLNENGLLLPAGVTVKVVENTDKLCHLTLPLAPSAAELSEEELEAVAGGFCGSCGPNHFGACGCRGPHYRCSICGMNACGFVPPPPPNRCCGIGHGCRGGGH